MRVIAGAARGVPLVAPAGHGTRPTSDKVKGAIFASLGDLGCEGRVLDLFAGSGALGIEALSRGADWCDFVDAAEPACRAIRANLARAKLLDRAQVHRQAIRHFLATAPSAYDLVLMDPPYAMEDLDSLLAALAQSTAIGERTVLLVEHASGRPLPAGVSTLRLDRVRDHGDSAYSLYLPG